MHLTSELPTKRLIDKLCTGAPPCHGEADWLTAKKVFASANTVLA